MHLEIAANAYGKTNAKNFHRCPEWARIEQGKGQGQSFVFKVLKQAGKASSGKSAVRHSAAGSSGDCMA